MQGVQKLKKKFRGQKVKHHPPKIYGGGGSEETAPYFLNFSNGWG